VIKKILTNLDAKAAVVEAAKPPPETPLFD